MPDWLESVPKQVNNKKMAILHFERFRRFVSDFALGTQCNCPKSKVSKDVQHFFFTLASLACSKRRSSCSKRLVTFVLERLGNSADILLTNFLSNLTKFLHVAMVIKKCVLIFFIC